MIRSTMNFFRLAIIAAGLAIVPASRAIAEPMSVTITGSLQSEIGCSGDYDVPGPNSMLTLTANDPIWRGMFDVPAGDFSYFAAIDGNIASNYGAHGGSALSPVALSLPSSQSIRFYYDDSTHWVTDDHTSTIATLAGSFQSELGCAADFDPTCLRSWLQDIDGDGIYTFTTILPTGSYDTVVAINESFDESYGPGGAPMNGSYHFEAAANPVSFRYDAASHLLQVDTGRTSAVPETPTWYMLLLGFGAIGLAARERQMEPIRALADYSECFSVVQCCANSSLAASRRHPVRGMFDADLRRATLLDEQNRSF
jgi:hypothetical protein